MKSIPWSHLLPSLIMLALSYVATWEHWWPLAVLALAFGCLVAPRRVPPPESPVIDGERRIIIKEGTLKKNLNDPPMGPRPPRPKAQVAPKPP